MYQVNEKRLDELMLAGTKLLEHLQTNSASRSDVDMFGKTLLSVQTEVHKQEKVKDIGFGIQRIEV